MSSVNFAIATTSCLFLMYWIYSLSKVIGGNKKMSWSGFISCFVGIFLLFVAKAPGTSSSSNDMSLTSLQSGIGNIIFAAMILLTTYFFLKVFLTLDRKFKKFGKKLITFAVAHAKGVENPDDTADWWKKGKKDNGFDERFGNN